MEWSAVARPANEHYVVIRHARPWWVLSRPFMVFLNWEPRAAQYVHACIYSTKLMGLVFSLTVSDLTAEVVLRLAREAAVGATRLTSSNLRVLTEFRRDRGVRTVSCGYGTTVLTLVLAPFRRKETQLWLLLPRGRCWLQVI